MPVNIDAMTKILKEGIRMRFEGRSPPEPKYVFPDPLLPGQTWEEYYEYSRDMAPHVAWGELSEEMKAYDRIVLANRSKL